MPNSEKRPVVVTILREEPGLAVGLTDMRSAGRLATVTLSEHLLAELGRRSSKLLGNGTTPAVGDAATQDPVRDLGGVIFGRLLPEPIRDYLINNSGSPLYLQLDERVIGIPWELAYDGESFLGEKFAIARQIVSQSGLPPAGAIRRARDVVKVLLVRGRHDTAGLAYADQLARRLETIDGVLLTNARVQELTQTQALKLVGEHDVVHYVGPLGRYDAGSDDIAWWKDAEISLRDVASLPAAPQLLISDDSRGAIPDASLARAASGSGLNLIMAPGGTAGGDGLQFMQLLHGALARGNALAEALRQTRALMAHRSEGGEILSFLTSFYGDASHVLVSRDRAPQRDNRRQVTLLSCDIVESTQLLKRLGDEKYADILERYRTRCARVVAAHGGYLEDAKGDGILCLFGYPVAHEDSAARCLRAARDILHSIADLDIRVRVGVATGEVAVAGRMPVGDVIHFTIRLQSNADVGTVFVAESTRQIVRARFVFERVDRRVDLKGFDDPGAVYRLVAESPTAGAEPFEATQRLTPFIGRAEELRAIEQHWSGARAGAARAVLISGEAGIGKSRLVHEFRRALVLRGERAIACRCTPDYVHSAFHPVIDFLGRHLDIQRADTVEEKLDKIERMLPPGSGAGAAALIAELLSIPFDTRYPPLRFSAERHREATLDILVSWIKQEAQAAPVCVIVEDTHWIDPSTRELLHRLVQQAARLPLLVLLTARPESARAVPGLSAEPIELKGLSMEAARAMVLGASGDARLPRDTVHFLAERADGVPLFIEESTRMALDVSAAAHTDFASALRSTVPATIHDLLMARLDRLPTAKQVAQLGATIGREFSLALLESVLAHESSPIRIDNLATRLAVLVDSGLLIEKGGPADTAYFFKHALIRDAAYGSLWERDRKRLHLAIATVIADKFPELTENQPEVLAHHYTEAGLGAKAIQFWEHAARRAASRSAHAEAISHLSHALDLVARQEHTPERDKTELRLQLMLAGRLIATEGYGADRVERIYTRALELCRVVGDESSLLKARLGLEAYHFMRADFDKAHEFASQAGAMLSRSADPVRRFQSQWTVGNILFHQGDGVSALQYWDACLAHYDRAHHRPSAVQDPGIMCLCYSAWLKWQLGYPDDAASRVHKVVALATELNHPFSMGEAYGFCTAVHHFRGESQVALRNAERAIQICEEGGFAVWLAHAKLMHGRIVAELGDPQAGIAEMRQAYDMWSATGAVVTRPFYLAQQAEGLGLAGRPDEALSILETAYDIVRRYGERYHEAEIRRLIGEFILQSGARHGRDQHEDAERWLTGALEVARTRQFRSMELRAATSLARLLLAQSRAREAVRILEPAYSLFSEGRNTGDLVRAQALLEELRAACT